MRALRFAAGALFAVSVAALIWIQLRMPGLALGGGTDPVLRDPYYLEAAVRQTTPFAIGAAAAGVVIFFAANMARAQGRIAKIGLWLTLAGGALALGFAGEWIFAESARFGSPRRYADIVGYKDDWAHGWALAIIGIAMLGCLACGVVAWLASYRLDRPRDAR